MVCHIVNTETGRKSQETTIPTLMVDERKIDNMIDKVNELCKHFTQNSANQLCDIKYDVTQYEDPQTLSKFFVCIEEVFNVIRNMNTQTSAGSDDIPAKFIKQNANEITPYLTRIINDIINEGEFPDNLKTAMVIPLYKQKGERSSVKNYRPISILPALAKIIEKIISDKIVAFLEQNECIINEQLGYWKNRSSQSAKAIFTDDVKNFADEGKKTGAIFIDFVQAFDKIQYAPLLEKYYRFGIQNKLLSFLKSYFSGRQLIMKSNMLSLPVNMISGTPQGSSLSGVNFTMYLNDIPERLEQCKCIFYADDCVLCTSGESLEEIKDKLQKDLDNLDLWCNQNGMEINIAKTS